MHERLQANHGQEKIPNQIPEDGRKGQAHFKALGLKHYFSLQSSPG
jgi:hypothetical protein